MGVASFTPPAAIELRRAQLILMLAALVPTALMIVVGIVLLALGQGTSAWVSGVLVLAFCTTAATGFILSSIYVARGATVARFQHDFLSSVSHELRTPLTAIQLYIETLRSERLTDPAERRQCLAVLDLEIHRLNGLVDRLIRLSRLETRRHRFERHPVRIAEVVADALAAFEAATLNAPTPVEVDVPAGDDLVVLGDRDALAQAVANLLINAWKYGAPEPARGEAARIRLVARAEGRQLDLAVVDNGPGIPRDEQGTIFDHFKRGQAAIEGARSGSGLGLAIVRATARGHHGKVEVRSAPGVGSAFHLRLPRARGATGRS